MSNTNNHNHLAHNIDYLPESTFESLGSTVQDFLDSMLRPMMHVNVLSSSSATTLTGTATKTTLVNASLSAGFWASAFDLFDSGSGFVDSLRFSTHLGVSSAEFDVTTNFNVKHTANDGRSLEFRALCYINNTLQGGGHIYTNTNNSNGAIETSERTTTITLNDGDALNYRIAYVNSKAGNGGALVLRAVYTASSSTAITSTPFTVPFNTSVESNSNYTLNGDGSVSIVAAGSYHVDWSVPIDGSSVVGNPRSNALGVCEYDVNDDGAGYVVLTQSRAGGQGIDTGFAFDAAAGSRIRLRVSQTGTVDISTEAGQSQFSIFRLPDSDGGSQSGRVDPFGYQITLNEVRTYG